MPLVVRVLAIDAGQRPGLAQGGLCGLGVESVQDPLAGDAAGLV